MLKHGIYKLNLNFRVDKFSDSINFSNSFNNFNLNFNNKYLKPKNLLKNLTFKLLGFIMLKPGYFSIKRDKALIIYYLLSPPNLAVKHRLFAIVKFNSEDGLLFSKY